MYLILLAHAYEVLDGLAIVATYRSIRAKACCVGAACKQGAHEIDHVGSVSFHRYSVCISSPFHCCFCSMLAMSTVPFNMYLARIATSFRCYFCNVQEFSTVPFHRYLVRIAASVHCYFCNVLVITTLSFLRIDVHSYDPKNHTTASSGSNRSVL